MDTVFWTSSEWLVLPLICERWFEGWALRSPFVDLGIANITLPSFLALGICGGEGWGQVNVFLSCTWLTSFFHWTCPYWVLSFLLGFKPLWALAISCHFPGTSCTTVSAASGLSSFIYFFFIFKLIYLFLAVLCLPYCVCRLSVVAASGATLPCGVGASHWSGFFCWGAQFLEQGLSSCGTRA